jgi:hypothetical protein
VFHTMDTGVETHLDLEPSTGGVRFSTGREMASPLGVKGNCYAW